MIAPLKTKSALPWFGSDSEVAPRLAGKFDQCNHVTIVFVGGAGIIPHLTAKAIVANDRHEAAITFYRVLSGWYGDRSTARLIDRCHSTLSHPAELEHSSSVLEVPPSDPVELAWALWAQCWIGRKGSGGTRKQTTSASVRRTADGGNNASRLRTAARDLESWAKHFQRCEWENQDFRDVLNKISRPKAVWYLLRSAVGWTGPRLPSHIHRARPSGLV